MEEKPITFNEIWQNKPARYAVLSIIALIILAIVAPFFPHLWLVWVAVALISATVYVVSTWLITARQQEGG